MNNLYGRSRNRLKLLSMSHRGYENKTCWSSIYGTLTWIKRWISSFIKNLTIFMEGREIGWNCGACQDRSPRHKMTVSQNDRFVIKRETGTDGSPRKKMTGRYYFHINIVISSFISWTIFISQVAFVVHVKMAGSL